MFLDIGPLIKQITELIILLFYGKTALPKRLGLKLSPSKKKYALLRLVDVFLMLFQR